jgi:hypothetical protein
MINFLLHDIISNLLGYAIHGVYYTLLIIWVAYKIKTIKLEHEFRKREINSYIVVRSSVDSGRVLGVEGNSCERCGKIGSCDKPKPKSKRTTKGDGQPKDADKDVPL